MLHHLERLAIGTEKTTTTTAIVFLLELKQKLPEDLKCLIIFSLPEEEVS